MPGRQTLLPRVQRSSPHPPQQALMRCIPRGEQEARGTSRSLSALSPTTRRATHIVSIHLMQAAASGAAISLVVVNDAYPVVITDTVFTRNSALFGGAVSVSGSGAAAFTVSMTRTHFLYNSGTTGGGLYMTNTGGLINLELTDGTLLGNTATDNGAAVAVNLGGYIRATTTVFQENAALKAGGGIHLSGGAYTSAEVTGCTFTKNSAGEVGGAVSAAGGAACWANGGVGSYFRVLSSSFTQNTATNLGAALQFSSCMYQVISSTFTGNQIGNNGGAGVHQSDTTTDTTWWGYNHNPGVTAPYALIAGQFRMPCYCFTAAGASDPTYGATCTACTSGNSAACEALIPAVPASATVLYKPTISKSVFDGSVGTTGAFGIALYFAGSATAEISNTHIINSVAGLGGGGAIQLEASTQLNISVTDSVIADNRVDSSGGALSLLGGRFSATRCTFQNNTAGHGGSGGSGVMSVVTGAVAEFTDSSFLDNQAISPLGTSGGGVAVSLGEILSFKRCTFKNNKDASKSSGGGVFVLEGSNPVLYLQECTFTDNQAANKAGAIFLKSPRAVVYDEGSTYSGNCGPAGGGVAYLNSGSQWTGFNSKFTSNYATLNGGAFFVDSGKLYLGELPPFQLSVSVDPFTAARTGPIGDNGCQRASQFNVGADTGTVNHDLCNFPAPLLTSVYPGPKAAGSTADYGCTFFNNSGSSGAAVHVNTKGYARISRAVFRQNRAAEYGGAVSVAAAGRSELDRLSCYDNQAAFAGGCVYWSDPEPTLNSFSSLQLGWGNQTNCSTACDNCTYKYNTAQYGTELATDTNRMTAMYSRQWGGIAPTGNDSVGEPLGTVEETAKLSRRQLYSLTEPSLSGIRTVPQNQTVYRPGIRFNMYFLAFDYFGNIVKSAENGNDLLTIVRPSIRNIGRDMYEFSGVVSKTEAPGAAEIVPIVFGGKAEVNYTWTLDYQWYRPDISPGTLKLIKKNATQMSCTQRCAVGERTIYDENQLRIRESEARDGTGSWDTVVESCVWCKAGTYSVKYGATECKDCPKRGAICNGGGSYIIPKKNYWRGYPGDDIYKCPFTGACLQGKGLAASTCEYGYKGVLCGTCREGWVQAGTKCVECGSHKLTSDMIAFILLIVIGLIVGTNVAIDKWFSAPKLQGAQALKILMAKKKKLARASAIAAQIKILIAYIQVTFSLMSVGSVEYPSALVSTFSAFSFVDLDVVALLKGICIGPEGGFTFYNIMCFSIFMPVCVFLVLLVHYHVTKPGPDCADTPENRSHGAQHYTIMLMLLFLVFPNTCKNVVDFFRCHEIFTTATTSEHYMFASYSVQCFDTEWFEYLPVGLLGVALYPIGTPLLFFSVLYKEVRKGEDRLAEAEVVAKVGFLYGRFKPEYWWYETCELIRKLAIGSLVRFIRPGEKSGTPTQLLVAIILNIFFLLMFLVCWPFKSNDDNMLMCLSLVAITVTLFGAIILSADVEGLDSWPDGTATGVMLGANGALIILFISMLCNYQMPFICEHLMPGAIQNSFLNCFRKKKTPEELEDERQAEAKREDLKIAREALIAKLGNVEIVEPPDPPPPPLPEPNLAMDDDELYDEMEKYFQRYDLDESGTLNSSDELQHLTTNLCFRLELPLAGEDIDVIVKSAGILSDKNAWSVDDFCEWFEERFLGGDVEEEDSMAGELMGMISLYQNMEMQDDIMEDYDDDNDDDGGDDGGD
eukprot:TRINITY_DN10572_c0_g4_i2.p1 TRINITY_DN10572_c0_g4~~TRINITY_DN10572_c0_g4_i2.p1  ORF type:complete len:1702 (-),score=372.54 TRINITY_DN10572_c0_g4_i2:89-5194(-)